MTNTMIVGLGAAVKADPIASETCLAKMVNAECLCLNHNYPGAASR